MSYTSKSEQQIINELIGNSPATEKSIQEALNRYYGFHPTQYTIQELFGLKTATSPYTAKSLQQYLFDNLKSPLSLTGSYVNYSPQEMLRRAQIAGLTIAQIVEGGVSTEAAFVAAVQTLSPVAYYTPQTGDTVAINRANPGTYDGTISGATIVDGLVGKAFSFDGVNDVITADNPLDYTANNSWTIGYIIKFQTQVSAFARIWGLGRSAPSLDKIEGFINTTSSYLSTNRTVNNVSNSVQQAGVTLANDTNYMMFQEYDGSNLRTYVNSSTGVSGLSAGSMPSFASTLYIGATYTGSGGFLTGTLNHFFMVNRILTQNEKSNLLTIAGLA